MKNSVSTTILETINNLLYSYLSNAYKQNEIVSIINEINTFSKNPIVLNKNDISKTYDELETCLSRINEKQSTRKEKGVYYTDNDITEFIVNECMIHYEMLFFLSATVFDPSCGSGEFLLTALKNKVIINNDECKKKSIKEIFTTIFGNDLNEESIFITKLRLFLFALTDTFISSNNNNLEKQETSDKSKNSLPTPHTHPKQIIFYGVPGCGKSHTISDMLKDTKEFTINSEEEQIVRTVFHPDYTNSDFVGQILPQVNDTKIEYNFVPGPFTKILAKALIHSENQYVLVIEEINRGNAAAIFGEIFQLLDRIKTGKTSKEKLSDGSINTYGEGWSEYFFMNDEINEYILKETNLEEGKNSADINGITFSVNTGIRLPPNLSILATMNTSDQNVFTLDNAFQRRWQMEYIPNKIDTTSAKFIGAVKNQYESTIGSTNVLWGSFRQVINDIIADPETSFSNAEDKQLGLFFINTTGDITNGKSIIDQKDFSNKVLKYLWNDIFKREKSEVFADEIKTFGDLLVNFDGADAFTKCFQSKITDLLEKE